MLALRYDKLYSLLGIQTRGEKGCGLGRPGDSRQTSPPPLRLDVRRPEEAPMEDFYVRYYVVSVGQVLPGLALVRGLRPTDLAA